MNNVENLTAEKITTGWPWRLLLFALIVFGVLLAAYLGLVFGYKTYLNSQVEKKDQEIAVLAQEVPQEEQRALLRFYGQLANLQTVLKNHTLISKLFPFIQANTNQQVTYTNLTLMVDERRLSIDGAARSYEVLAQQLEAFKQAPEVERFLINQADSKTGIVNFRVALFLKPEVLK